jgi:peptidoglycan pentaglycine glycine transferase (the first glycine)
MNKLRVDDQLTDREWDRFVVAHPNGHVLQTSAWGQLKSEFGWRTERVALRSSDGIAAGAQILFRRLPLGLRLAYVPKGPLVDFRDVALSRMLLDALHRKCQSRSVMLKIEPDVLESAQGGVDTWTRLAFRPSSQTVQPRRTVLLDIAGSEDEILGGMKSKTRYNIRLAERKGVRVHAGTEQDLGAFDALMATTGERDAFGVRSPAYYNKAYALFAPLNMVHLLIATYEEQPIAGLMAFACGAKAWYMFGGSANEHREKMPNYLLQWEAIRWARSQGCTTYDLFGVPDCDQDTLEARFMERSDGLWGVYRFKRGFGGTLARYVGAFDYVYSKPLYWLYQRALAWRAGHMAP